MKHTYHAVIRRRAAPLHAAVVMQNDNLRCEPTNVTYVMHVQGHQELIKLVRICLAVEWHLV